MKTLFRLGLLLRHIYTKIFEFIIIKRYNLSNEEKEILKNKVLEYKNDIKTIENHIVKLKSLNNNGYIWISDPLNGLIDWEPSEKNLWTFFYTGQNVSRDCDDFAALTYFILKPLAKVTEWCVLVDKKLTESHMIVTVEKNGNKYLFDNHIGYLINKNTVEEEIKSRFNCEEYFLKYR